MEKRKKMIEIEDVEVSEMRVDEQRMRQIVADLKAKLKEIRDDSKSESGNNFQKRDASKV
jgi:hypothetical protein